MANNLSQWPWQKRELVVLLFCFGFAFLLNVYAIIHYHGGVVELFSQIGYVCVITGVIYVLTVLVRLLIWLISLIARRIRRRP
jgi:hypothetical protein